jgi:vacuolar-type H+-ATPase subunit I/STV1
MSEYEARQLEDAIYTLQSLCNQGRLDGLFSIENLRQIANEGYIDMLKDACKKLLEAQESGLIQQLTNFNQNTEDLTRTIRGYEATRLCEAIEKIKPLLSDKGRNDISALASNLNDSALTTIAQFVDAVNTLKYLAEGSLQQLNNNSKDMSRDISTLTSLVNDLSREVYELRQDREARQRDNINLEIRNYLDLLKDPMMMQALGLTREMIAAKLAELLNQNGLQASYITDVAKADTKQNSIK